jgi:hypothetical protein
VVVIKGFVDRSDEYTSIWGASVVLPRRDCANADCTYVEQVKYIHVEYS